MAKALAKGSRITGPQRDTLASQYAKRYAAGDSIRKIADEGGRSFGFVHGVLKEAKVALRGRGGATRGARAGTGAVKKTAGRRRRQEDAGKEVDDESRDQGEQRAAKGKSAAATKAAAKATTKKTAKSTPAKSTAKSAPARGCRKSPAKSAAKKATKTSSTGPVKKSAARKSPAKKTSAKKIGQEGRRQESHGEEELTWPERQGPTRRASGPCRGLDEASTFVGCSRNREQGNAVAARSRCR